MNKAGKMNPAFERIEKYYYDNPSTHTNGEFDVVWVWEDDIWFNNELYN